MTAERSIVGANPPPCPECGGTLTHRHSAATDFDWTGPSLYYASVRPFRDGPGFSIRRGRPSRRVVCSAPNALDCASGLWWEVRLTGSTQSRVYCDTHLSARYRPWTENWRELEP